MANSVIGALRVTLGADTAAFSSDLGKAEKKFDAFGRSAQKTGGTVGSAFSAMGVAAGTFGKTLAAGLAAGGIAGVITTVRDVARGVAEVGDQAKKAGVDVKSFQELKFVAEQNRVGVDSLTDGLKELSLRADEFIVTGKGSAADAFERLGYSAATLKEKLKQPSALFAEIIGRLQQFDKAAQIRISDEVFGGEGGEQFVQFIEQGEAGIRNTIQTANDLGIVMDEQLIAKAAEIDRQFNVIASTVGTALKSAIVSAADSLAEFIDGFRSYQNQMSGTLEKKQAELGLQRLDIENEILSLQDKQRQGAEKLSSTAIGLGFEDSKNANVAGYSGQIDALRGKVQALNQEEKEVVNILSQRIAPMQRSGERTWTPPATKKETKKSGGRSKGEKDAERQEKTYQRVTQSLQDELAAMGENSLQQEIMEQQRRAGVTAASAQGQQIAALVTQLENERATMSAAAEVSGFFQSSLQEAFSSITPSIETGNDALDSFLNKLIDATQQALLFGQGPLASLFGTASTAGGKSGGLLGGLFSGLTGFANGGTIMPGGNGAGIDSQVVAFRKSPTEQVDIHDPRKSKSSGGGASYYSIDARGADQGAVSRIEAALKKVDGSIEKRAVAAQNFSNKRKYI